MAPAAILGLAGLLPKRGFVRPTDSDPANLTETYDKVFLQLDAIISEAPSYTGTPTMSEVEDGEEISDHVTLKPLELSVQGIVSDTPMLSRIANPNPNPTISRSPSPKQAAYDFLKKLQVDRRPFDFVGGFEVYRSMVITSFTPTRTKETGDTLRFSCTMRQIKTVSSQILTIAPKSKKSAMKKQSQGSQLKDPLDPTQSTQVHSTYQAVTQGQGAAQPALLPSALGF